MTRPEAISRPEAAPAIPLAGWFYRAAAALAFLTVVGFVLLAHGPA